MTEPLLTQYEAIDLTGLYAVLAAGGAPGCVYGLTDPRRDHQVAYVGQTSQRVVARYLQHIAETAGKRAKACWMCELQTEGLFPGLVILERCEASAAVLLAKESAWVAKLQAQGAAWINPPTKADPERLRAAADAREREWKEAHEALRIATERKRQQMEKNERIKQGMAEARARKAAQTRLENRRQEIITHAENRRARNTEMLGLRAFIPVVVE